MRMWLVLAGINGAMAVAAGAYASHGLAEAGPQAERWMQLASTYQLVHAVGLVALAAATPALRATGRAGARVLGVAAGLLFQAGIVMFCGALYGLALDAWAVSGMAPAGGFAFIAGWLALSAAGITARQ
ncbi:DUF423 domain-containing protein [Novispirillum sp. DQ9]|uniref:DUF423 domain-containing protein n=1 Tax=Novispirillum sp. DQ9 TaxID=3398612 RepID=UPI003C7E9FD6